MRPTGLDPNDPQVRTAVFGQQVQDFLRSEIGDYLIKHAQQHLDEAIGRLKAVDPTQPTQIMALQVEIRYLENFVAWLGNAVQDGLNAVAALEAGEDGGG